MRAPARLRRLVAIGEIIVRRCVAAPGKMRMRVVWRVRVFAAKRLGGAARGAPLWSAAERAAIERETGRV